MQNRKVKERWKKTKYLTIALTKISEKNKHREITLSQSFFPRASTPASSDLKSSINSNKSQQLKKPQIPKSSKSKINQQVTEETSLPMPH